MADPSYLDRHTGEPSPSSFTALREAGIAMLQTLCGETWTDYNLHDPGVTLLEQLCYGLTDLAYRTGFAAEDYLFDASGRIDRDRFALVPPEEWIFFGHAMIWHGRRVCTARKADCGECRLLDVCPRIGVE